MGVTRFRVVLTVAALNAEWGGPSRSVPALADALIMAGVETEVVTLDLGPRRSLPILPQRSRVRQVRCRGTRHVPTLWAWKYREAVGEACAGKAAIWLHDNGLWLPTNHLVASVARRRHRPFMVCPRGMLSAWALGFRAWRKRLAWLFYARRDLDTACAFHVTSLQEAEEVRRLGLRQPVVVAPNGVEIPPAINHATQKKGTRSVLFLSRIHPKKGLVHLIEAWSRLRPSGWRVIVAGPAEPGHLAELKRRLRGAGLEADFEFPGPVEGEAKWTLYRQADLFVLPSLSENFGLVVAEALASGCPVITTQATPWEELATHRCGWWIPTGADALEKALDEAISQPGEVRQAMGERGRRLVEARYGWQSVARRLIEALEWLTYGGRAPDCVVEGSPAPTSPAARHIPLPVNQRPTDLEGQQEITQPADTKAEAR